jgi:hypothetical protein
VVVFLTIRIIKRKIDPHPLEAEAKSAGPEYRESESQQQIAGSHFEQSAIQANTFTEYDTCTERFMKKIGEINVNFNPLLLALPLNFVLGRSYAFVIVVYFLAAVFCLVFNVFKVHRACVEFRASRLFLESIWICLTLLLLVNIWVTDPSSMPYLIRT